MLNKFTFMGRLVADPALQTTPNGVSVTKISVACERDFKNPQTGEKEVDFFDVVAWRNTAEYIAKYFTKGRMVVVDGRMQIRWWTDDSGLKRRVYEVVAVNVYPADSPKANTASESQETTATAPAPAPSVNDFDNFDGFMGMPAPADSDLPF